ncbi:LysR family transcriptional regulator [Herbaspirillum robiniae]|uniref:LysR family transcriptional regulator n=1 Tax=Herbaspirillum robiniae TaxID=2014887 RepID=UPI003D771053
MKSENWNDLQAFVVVARERSFTRAAAQLGMSRSALSHAMLGLEARLGIRLLTRTTRSVSTTEAGERLLATLAPRFSEISAEIEALTALRDKPAGVVRITAHDHAIVTVLWPKLLPMLHANPDVQVEFSIDYGLVNIVAQNFDAGVRTGNLVEKDMVAVPIAPPLRMAVVGSPAYMANRRAPSHPRELTEHRCINLRLPTLGGLYAWDFARDAQELNVRVQGQAVFNNTFLMLQAALDGIGLAYVPHDLVAPHVDAGRLIAVLEDWWPSFPGYHLYYASRQKSPALALVVNALKLTS